MKVLFGSYLDHFMIILFGMVPEWCLSRSGHLQILPQVGEIPTMELSLREGETLAMEIGSRLPTSGG